MASSSAIPLVDLSSSQEDDIVNQQDSLQQSGGNKRKDIVHILEDSITPKRARPNGISPKADKKNSISKIDKDSILYRIKNLESRVMTTLSNPENNIVTREEFEGLVKKVEKIDQRLKEMEKLFLNLKSVFVGSNAASVTKSAGSKSASNAIVHTNSLTGNNFSETSTPRLPQSISASRRISFPGNMQLSSNDPQSPYRRNVIVEGPTNVNNPPVNMRISASVSPQASMPVMMPKPNQSYPRSTSHSQSSNQNRNSSVTASALSFGRDVLVSTNPIITSNELTGNLSEILSGPPIQQETNLVNYHNLNINDLNDDTLRAVRVKEEVILNESYERIGVGSFRKDEEDNFLVYIDGGGQKCRNQEKYVAYIGFSLSNEWVRVKLYESDLKMVTLRKNIDSIKKQAEIIAAYFAIEDIKRNSGQPGPWKIKIVTKQNKLVTTMSNLHSIYYNLRECCCPDVKCPHDNRWETYDSFAAAFPDDLPSLAHTINGMDVEVSWRTYSSAELLNKELWDTFKKKFKEENMKNKEKERGVL